MSSEKYTPLDFTKYLSFPEVKRTAKLLMFRSYFSKKGVCPKSVTKTLYRNKFLVSECIFRLVCHCESCRSSEIAQWAHHVESTSIRRGYYVDMSKTKFRRISTWFPRTFFDVISLAEKFTWFPRTFFDVISMVEKSTWFPHTFFDVISMVEICTLFLLSFFDVILLGKDLTSFLVSCKLMKTFKKFFPVFVTLNS